MRQKIIIFVIMCVAVAVSIEGLFGFFGFLIFRSRTTFIDGIPYSNNPTPYGIFTIRFFDLLDNGYLQPASMMRWLLYFSEPTPPNVHAQPSGTIQVAGPPPPWGDVMISGWLYSQLATNFTEFAMPQSSKTFWTETSKEPIPPNAQIISP
jgi:hypothetical protein